MRFDVPDELRLFAESMRSAIGDWEPQREPDFGTWQDDRDDALAERLAATGWAQLWASSELLGPAVAGGVELGRAVAPVCLVDEVTLGAPLAVEGRARHGWHARALALPLRREGLALGPASSGARPELSLDGSGTVSVDVAIGGELEPVAAAACWHAWSATTLAYLAGLAGRALDLAVEHARTREQFGAPLAALPAVQSRLADAALAVDTLTLLAWSSITSERTLPTPELLWAGAACCEVTASAHQVHGAIGFALETGLHRYYRRARALHAWTTAVCAATRE
ncbi:MAG: acyl-CoA dehydrogenase family protein [Gaiellaceae bacterium]